MPRKADPNVRRALTETAARLLAEEGPAAISTRRLAREVGTSTTAVYTHFGGKDDLVRAMCIEGFDRLARRMARVRRTDDPVTDLTGLARAYRRNALANPHLYAVMFGGRTMPDYAPTAEDRGYGWPTLAHLADTAERCVAAGRFDPAPPYDLAVRLWATAHGLVSLELDGFFPVRAEADRHYEHMLLTCSVGLGDDLAAAEASVGSVVPARPR